MYCLYLLVLLFSVVTVNGASIATMCGQYDFTSCTTVTETSATCYDISDYYSASMKLSGAEGIRAYKGKGCQGESVQFMAPVSYFGDVYTYKIQSFSFVKKIAVVPASPAPSGDVAYGVCSVVLVVDNYVYRELSKSLSLEQIIRKYTSYFSDVNAYYSNTFDTRFDLSYIYVESSSSFTDTIDGGALLDNFRAAVVAKKFGTGMPTDACVYHLISGRRPAGIGGLGWVGTACRSSYNAAYTIDGNGQEGAGIVIRRMIHEIGHNFGGNHPDYYTSNGYTCSVNDNLGNLRILRAAATEPFSYVEAGARMSDCAIEAIKNSLPAQTCLYKNNPTTLKTVTFYGNQNYGGQAVVMAPRRGTVSCYTLQGSAGTASSIKGSVSGSITVYDKDDCRGTSATINIPTTYVGDAWNDKIRSFRFSSSVAGAPLAEASAPPPLPEVAQEEPLPPLPTWGH